jgi:hypothetical protein
MYKQPQIKKNKINPINAPPEFCGLMENRSKKNTETQQAKSRVIEVLLLSLQPPLDQQVPLGIVFFWCLRHGCVEAI